MRPVERGNRPEDENGNKIEYAHYGNARSELINRLGEYCSYCEMPIKNAPAVEHIRPKTFVPDMENDWSNFLLACNYCNSLKAQRCAVPEDYFWPDKNNTFMALQYSEGGLVNAADDLNVAQRIKAQATIKLTGLNNTPANKASDKRLESRRLSWKRAQLAKLRLLNNNYEAFREQIVDTAEAIGFWSVWMTVFKDDPDMLRRFIEAFPGTCKVCFDEQNNYAPIFRNGAEI